jgi:hypothetical protein
VQDTGETIKGVSPADLLLVPDVKFFRGRGLEEIVYMPYDVHGNLITENGKPISGERYLEYLKSVVPPYFVTTKDFQKFQDGLLGRERPETGRSYGW